jgi:hypothetical protein
MRMRGQKGVPIPFMEVVEVAVILPLIQGVELSHRVMT